MDYLRSVRNVTCVLFAVVMIIAWSGILHAYPEGDYCATEPPLSAMWRHSHEFSQEQCADAQDICDEVCRNCYGSNWECGSTAPQCYPGDGVFGYCVFN